MSFLDNIESVVSDFLHHKNIPSSQPIQQQQTTVSTPPDSVPGCTKAQFAAAFPELKSFRVDEVWPGISWTLNHYEINTPQRVACFLATCGYESGSFTTFVENLNYSAEALQVVFKKYFPNAALATQYARNPQAIANRVYANRGGNGPESSGDGWKYRGSGGIQVTFKNTLSAFALSVNKSLDDACAYARTTIGGCVISGWFWSTNNLNKYADQNQFTQIQALVNTGNPNSTPDKINGYNSRIAMYNRVRKVFGA